MEAASGQVDRNRIVSLDILRGLMLVIMTFDHLGGYIKMFTFEPIGYVSAAEGFIYISGYVYGLVYTKTLINSNFESLRKKSLKRAVVIYFYHLFVLFILVVPMFLNILEFEELKMFKAQPIQSFLLFALLLLQPSNMDILSIYIVFILFGPLVINAYYNRKGKLVFFICGLLWFLSQLKIFQYNNYNYSNIGFCLGYFNIFSWQLLFFIGCYLGSSKSMGYNILPVSKKLLVLSLVTMIIFIAVKYSPFPSLFFSVIKGLTIRNTLGIARLINFSVIAYIIYILTLRFERIVASKWLSLLGRHSLQVFAYSVCLVYLYKQFEANIKSLGPCVEILIHMLLILSLSIPAYLHYIAVSRSTFIKRIGI